MKYNITLVFFIITFGISAQEIFISGEIKDSKNNSNLDYVNIGIFNKNVGTVSNEKGIFKLKLNEKVTPNDTVVFSHIGFQTKKILLSQLKSPNNIVTLAPSENVLKEVVVKFKKPASKQFGRSSKGLALMHANFFYAMDKTIEDRLSREKGMQFKIKKDCKVNDLNFNITGNDFKSVKFRLNFYKVENDLPSKIIIEKDILFEVKDGFRGLYTLDLKPYDIYLEKEMGEIAVTIQWIESVKKDENSKFFAISTAMSPTETSFAREKNMSTWHKSSQSLTFYLNTMCQ